MVPEENLGASTSGTSQHNTNDQGEINFSTLARLLTTYPANSYLGTAWEENVVQVGMDISKSLMLRFACQI